ncbi:hypothetical protein Tco_1092089 [Tanacetum coccineum]|uniref:Uncharacterized protein n=1 Tax=Tanacetum coccineum TaxID=301880 RepID=A0ABQ5I8U3_9ASTR
MQASTSQSQEVIEIERESERAILEAFKDIDVGKLFKLEDMEPLIDVIGNIRCSLSTICVLSLCLVMKRGKQLFDPKPSISSKVIIPVDLQNQLEARGLPQWTLNPCGCGVMGL